RSVPGGGELTRPASFRSASPLSAASSRHRVRSSLTPNRFAMPRPRSRPDYYLLSKVSTLYYTRGLTQQEIADRLHISRPKVSRLLQEALNHNIVRISIA